MVKLKIARILKLPNDDLMKILVCPDKFKGTATAMEVSQAIERGLLRNKSFAVKPEITILPIADGGEGFAMSAANALAGKWLNCETLDALHRPIKADYFVSAKVAYIDMSAASGLDKIDTSDLNPLFSSTRGTGIMMRHAIEHGAEKLVIGLGGSATNDGGAGMATELGVKFLDASGNLLEPIPSELMHCATISLTDRMPLPEIVAACDVSNRLLGDEGATAIYGTQKGVIDVAGMDAILQHLVLIASGEESAMQQGAGAAGGLAYGLMHYAHAELKSGFNLVAEMIGLEEQIASSEVVITGEGSLDAQTLNGKGPDGVAKLAKKYSKPIYAIAGKQEECVRECFTEVISLLESGYTREECMSNIQDLIEEVTAKLVI